MKKVYKGEFGYVKYRRKAAVIRTLIMLAIAVGFFVAGLIIFGSQKNVLSIIAALCCLPAGLSAVNMIMFLRAGFCKDEDHDKILKHCGDLLIHYDHVITSYDKNFNVHASTVLDKNICLYSDDDSFDASDLEKHVKKMMAQIGYSDYSIKLFNNIDKYCERLDQLEKLRADRNIDPKAIEDAWVPGTLETPASVLLSISL
ncbi:hypothetical protein [Butyrivibrio sp. FCS014]|uniref:hypothetical protein n=1 Tax=Butyrivibrio sp. FCS014 TaxID=1408304 RepID=UPI0004655332|nr:hypothetical protein [Butyrivibrio sp. FCS014]